jgi:hypothetical protein
VEDGDQPAHPATVSPTATDPERAHPGLMTGSLARGRPAPHGHQHRDAPPATQCDRRSYPPRKRIAADLHAVTAEFHGGNGHV